MKTSHIILVAFVTAFASSVLGVFLYFATTHESTAAEPALVTNPIPGKLAELEASQRELASAIDALRSELRDSASSGSGRVSMNEVEQLVALALENRAVAAGETIGEADVSAPGKKKLNIAAHALELLRDDLTDQEKQALWAKAHESGQGDELLAWFEDRAKANPNDADAQTDLGSALLQKLFVVPEGPAKGELAMRADAAFDSALALDDQHWEARFSKAVSLSFWPPVFGKQREAINHFETLISQQAGQAPNPGFASTHLLLGNMYGQMGQTDKAIATWQAGAALYPNNADLQAQLAEHQ